MRLPGRPADASDPLAYELLQEMAASLGRAGRRLDGALRALAAAGPAQHEAHLEAAAEALWYYVVQREACGLRDTDDVVDRMAVPREVRLRMGCRPPAAAILPAGETGNDVATR